MSYQVLARKWRPQRFSDVVGQQHVLAALENSLREGRLHHAYLFSGTRGVGKTSIARLFAKGLNCEVGITPNPCGNCANCKAIEEGRFIDLIEIDAASRTKVEDTRELLDNVQYKPTVGRFKVYLIDEVHMLSRSSFNALLKTLEEPPEYVKFLLATTDPQKLPITILSRCMQFHLRALEQTQIRDHLAFILKQEQIPFELAALDKLAKAAEGSIRDSLSLTDQAIAVSNGDISLSAVSQMLGLIDDHQPLELVTALANNDGERAMAVVEEVAEKGGDWTHLLRDVAEVLHQIAMLQLIKHPEGESTQLQFLAKQLPPEEVQFLYQMMVAGKKELTLAPELRTGVEMTILRALAFHPKRTEAIQAQVPAVSQPQSASEPSTAQHNVARLKASLADSAAEKTRSQSTPSMPRIESESDARSAKNSENFTASSAETSSSVAMDATSPALAAMEARRKLQQNSEAAAPHEKKKPEVQLVSQLLNVASQASSPVESKVESKPAVALKVAEKPKEEPKEEEDYRWTWLNPELENQIEQEKPSDIKQAILQEKTPELVAKTIALSCEQDEWCRIIQTLNLSGLTRQLVLNSVLAHQENGTLSLLLKPAMAHLDNDASREALTNALAAQGLQFELQHQDDESRKTPLELRRAIFEKLTQEARTALLNDNKLALLRQAFGAEIDESTIRAV